jgi:hypothetical protein
MHGGLDFGFREQGFGRFSGEAVAGEVSLLKSQPSAGVSKREAEIIGATEPRGGTGQNVSARKHGNRLVGKRPTLA